MIRLIIDFIERSTYKQIERKVKLNYDLLIYIDILKKNVCQYSKKLKMQS